VAVGERRLHWDNAPAHTDAVVKDWLAATCIQLLEHPPHLPDLAPAHFFLLQNLKMELASQALSKETFKREWEGVCRTLSEDDFAVTFSKLIERCDKCVGLQGTYVEKS